MDYGLDLDQDLNPSGPTVYDVLLVLQRLEYLLIELYLNCQKGSLSFVACVFIQHFKYLVYQFWKYFEILFYFQNFGEVIFYDDRPRHFVTFLTHQWRYRLDLLSCSKLAHLHTHAKFQVCRSYQFLNQLRTNKQTKKSFSFKILYCLEQQPLLE